MVGCGVAARRDTPDEKISPDDQRYGSGYCVQMIYHLCAFVIKYLNVMSGGNPLVFAQSETVVRSQ